MFLDTKNNSRFANWRELFMTIGYHTERVFNELMTRMEYYTPGQIAQAFFQNSEDRQPFIFHLTEKANQDDFLKLIKYAFGETQPELERKNSHRQDSGQDESDSKENSRINKKFQMLSLHGHKLNVFAFIRILRAQKKSISYCLQGLNSYQLVYLLKTIEHENGYSALHYAFQDAELSRYFTDKIAALPPIEQIRLLSIKTRYGRNTPLMKMCEFPDILKQHLTEIAFTASERTALLRAQNIDGQTVIHILAYANKSNHPLIMRCLVNLTNAQKNELLLIQNKDGLTPLHILAETNPQYIQTLLNGLPVSQIVNLLSIQNFYTAPDATQNYLTPLHVIAYSRSNFQCIVSLLRQLPANEQFYLLSMQDDKGFSILHRIQPQYVVQLLIGLSKQQKIQLLLMETRRQTRVIQSFLNTGIENIEALLEGLLPTEMIALLCKPLNRLGANHRPVSYFTVVLSVISRIQYNNIANVDWYAVHCLKGLKPELLQALQSLNENLEDNRELVERLIACKQHSCSLLNLILRYKRSDDDISVNDVTKTAQHFSRILSQYETALSAMRDSKQVRCNVSPNSS